VRSEIDRTNQPEEDRVLYETASEATRDDRSYDTDAPGAGIAGGAVGGAAAGAIAGTLIGGPIGTAVGAAVGAVGGAIVGRAVEGVDEDATGMPGGIDPGAGGLAGPGGLGLGASIAPFNTGATAGVGGLGIPAAPIDDHARNIEGDTMPIDKDKGPFDNAAAYSDTAAEIGQERQILVGDDPGYEAAESEMAERDIGGSRKSGAAANEYIRDRDDLAQGGTPR